MQRRKFIELSVIASLCLAFKDTPSASEIDMSKIDFSKTIYEQTKHKFPT